MAAIGLAAPGEGRLAVPVGRGEKGAADEPGGPEKPRQLGEALLAVFALARPHWIVRQRRGDLRGREDGARRARELAGGQSDSRDGEDSAEAASRRIRRRLIQFHAELRSDGGEPLRALAVSLGAGEGIGACRDERRCEKGPGNCT